MIFSFVNIFYIVLVHYYISNYKNYENFIFKIFFFDFEKKIYNSKCNNELKKIKKKKLTKLKIMICLFHQNGKSPFWK